ncbi:hypothetical protein RhiirA4_449783 [Rhizophagus irregularis]|uniref:Uncharacterized protein n=1 Tax=Rhizophagus irregularis TaxID=588596 RepID=A0A2I1HQB1_9GLOM|nr:hypothetical protein RhiirA4_449783 [Rhizophagus irregularis]
MTKARKSPKPAKASKPAKLTCQMKYKLQVKGRERGGRGRGRAKAITEPIKPVEPIEYVPNASGEGGRDHGRAKAVTESIESVEPIEHVPNASEGGGRGHGRAKAVTEPIEPIEPIEHVPNASGGGGRGRKVVTKPIEPIEPEHASIASGGGGRDHDRDRGCGKTNKLVESDVSTTIKDKTGHSGKSSPNVITVHDDNLIYDDPPDDFSASELPERSQFGQNDHFTLDYSAILDESNENNYELETAGVSTNNIYDHSESSDKDEDDEDRKTEVSMSRDKPKALNGMENILEVCQWLITERQDILFIANQMYNASNASLDSPLVNMPTSLLMMKPAAITLNDEKDLARLWHEEIKCLFL